MPSDTLELISPDAAIPPESESITLWNPLRDEALRIKRAAETLTITGVDDKKGMALARATRLAIRDVRLLIEKKHKELKEPWLEGGRKVDGAKNELIAIIEPLEDRLKKMEQFAISEGIRIEDELRRSRTDAITPFLDGPLAVDLGKISEEQFANMLSNAIELRELHLKREREAEEARVAKEKAEEVERERIRLENAELKRVAAEKEAAAEVERKRIEAERQKEREVAAAKQREVEETARKELLAEQARREVERTAAAAELKKQQDAAAETARLLREATAERERQAEIIRQKERAAQEEEARVEREAAAIRQREADAKAADERSARLAAEQAITDALRKVEREKKAAEVAAKKAAAAPDVEKLRTLRGVVLAMSLPGLASETANTNLACFRTTFAQQIGALAASLEGDAP